MKKTLLSLAVAALSVGAMAQTYHEVLAHDYDGTTPCSMAAGWNAATNNASAGGEVNPVSFNAADGTLDFAVNSVSTNHGPYYQGITVYKEIGDVCKTDSFVSADYFEISMKASTTMDVVFFIQEGISPSWNYAGFSESHIETTLTTDYQVFQFDISATNLPGGSTIDLDNIGMFAIGLSDHNGSYTTGLSNEKIQIDYLKFSKNVTGIFNSATEASFEVFPNPANGDVVNFSSELNNVIVMNSLGSVVFETASAKEMNISSFENGMYILKSDEGSTKLVVE